MKIESSEVENNLLYKLFRGRCPKCKRWAVTIHELEPRSRGKDSMRRNNRTPIDAECHEEFHRQGASEENIEAWKLIIKTYLVNLGNWEEYNAEG